MSSEFRHFEDIVLAAKKLPPISVAVIDADEKYVLEGACEAADEGYIEPILIGEEKVIRTLMVNITCGRKVTIIDAKTDNEMAEKGVEMIEQGKVDALMKGHIHTDVFLHPVLAHHLQGAKRISHVFMADLKTYPKLLYITDAAINISPDLLTKMGIVQNAVDVAILLGIPEPKVVALSAVEIVTPFISSTIDAACLAKMSERGQIKDCIVDGPLAFDNAISEEAAKIKGIKSPVAGHADILLVPDLVSGNILAKDLEYLASAQMAGIVVGAKIPIILTSRADPPRARVLSCAIASLVAHREKAKGS